jgi:hypothetical protein
VTVLIAFFLLSSKQTSTVYVELKASQGFWWVRSGNANLWLSSAIKKGDKEYNLLGEPIAEILEVRYYPIITLDASQEDQYNVYIKAKLEVSYNERTKEYTYNRDPLLVGSPVNINAGNSGISGSLMRISKSPLNDQYVEKTLTLTKKAAFPWEFSQIKIGDEYFDGQDTVFKVLSKRQIPTSLFFQDSYGNVNSSTVDPRNYIVITAKVKLRKEAKDFVFGEENLINSGSGFRVSTSNFDYNEFFVSSVK